MGDLVKPPLQHHIYHISSCKQQLFWKKIIILNSHGDTMYLHDFLNFRGNWRLCASDKSGPGISKVRHLKIPAWNFCATEEQKKRSQFNTGLSVKLIITQAWKIVTQFVCGVSDRYLNCLASIQTMNLSHLSLYEVLETHLSLTKVAVWCKGAFEHLCHCVKVFPFLRR